MKVNHLFFAVLAAGMLSSCGRKDDVPEVEHIAADLCNQPLQARNRM